MQLAKFIKQHKLDIESVDTYNETNLYSHLMREKGRRGVIFKRPYGTFQEKDGLMFPDMNIGAIFGCLYETNGIGKISRRDKRK